MTPNDQTAITNHQQLISELVTTARAAQSVLAQSAHDMRCAALTAAAAQIRAHSDTILAHNRTDLERGAANGLTAATRSASKHFLEDVGKARSESAAKAAGSAAALFKGGMAKTVIGSTLFAVF